MVNLQQASEEACDPMMVEQLVRAAAGAMEHASIPDMTTPSELLSATFTLLERTLYAMRKLQAKEDRAYNAKAVAKVLNDMLVDFGSVPN